MSFLCVLWLWSNCWKLEWKKCRKVNKVVKWMNMLWRMILCVHVCVCVCVCVHIMECWHMKNLWFKKGLKPTTSKIPSWCSYLWAISDPRGESAHGVVLRQILLNLKWSAPYACTHTHRHTENSNSIHSPILLSYSNDFDKPMKAPPILLNSLLNAENIEKFNWSTSQQQTTTDLHHKIILIFFITTKV